MSNSLSRAQFFKQNARANAWASLDHATNQQKKITPGPIRLKKNQYANKRVLILGAGVSGLTAAYELLAQQSGMQVTVLEAANRTGGRCLSLRTGNTFTEDKDSQLFDSSPGQQQTVRFKHPVGDSQPYFNAGPGRIPSSHKRLLSYLRLFDVAVEVYVMNSESNLIQRKKGPLGSKPVPYRRLNHNSRGWLAQMVFEKAEDLLLTLDPSASRAKIRRQAALLRDFMISFGELVPLETSSNYGKYLQTAGDDGEENALARAGYKVLPGVDAGVTEKPLSFESLLKSEFWKRFYQPIDFPWQPTMFQPVGGMDMVQRSFSQQVASLGGRIELNRPVQKVDWDPDTREFVVKAGQLGTNKQIEYRADYCFSSIALPFLKRLLSRRLQSSDGLSVPFMNSLKQVFKAQFNPGGTVGRDGYVSRFLANTTKVGWQADRELWQGGLMQNRFDRKCGETLSVVPRSKVGVVPIYGGISFTDDEIVQIWYPSSGFHDEKGVLTGAYNFGSTAYKWGNLSVQKRLNKARKGAKLFDNAFGGGLHDGIAIAWQNMPYIKGGWAQWHVLGDDAPRHFNTIAQGSRVGKKQTPVFFVIGDQMSSLPGWQEGAIAAALNAISRVARPDLEIPYLLEVPDTRLMVEGV